MTFLAFVLTQPVHATTYMEDFGTLQSSGCTSQWYGGVCESGQTAAGVDDSLGMCYTSGSNYGVEVKPDSLVGGFGTNIAIVSGKEIFTLTASIHVLADDTRGRLQLVFRNSGGSVVSTVSDTEQVDEGVYQLQMVQSIPSSAASVDIAIIGVSSGTDFWVDWISAEQDDPPTDADCQSRADAVKNAKDAKCIDEGGTPDGQCTGTADATMAGGCKIECILTCTYATSPAVVTCPSGF